MAALLDDSRSQAISKKNDDGLPPADPASQPPQQQQQQQQQQNYRGWRFWAVFPGLCFAILLAALDTSVLATALPTIVDKLHSGPLYIWTINGYSLSVAAIQPVAGKASDVFGRRYPMIASIVLFALGSGLCGGASSIEMLIAARIIQGFGGGGIFVMVDIIVADLVPLRERQNFMSIIMGTFALGTFIGPVLGGAIVARASWRWIFYMNLPVAGVALVLVSLFLRVRWTREGTLSERISRVDVGGNAILSAAIVSVLLALTWGGTAYTWSSWHVLLPLLSGTGGLVLFGLHQEYVATDPTMPRRVYGNTTSFLAYALTFLHGIVMSWLSFFLPVFFQVLLRASPMRSGVDLLAIVIPLMPAGIAGGLAVARTGRYKPTILLGYSILCIGVGLLTLLTQHSSTAEWVLFQVIAGVGGGLSLTSTLPAVQAPLAEKDVAVATASWAFVRSFGSIWGAAIPAAVFNSHFDAHLSHISDAAVRQQLARGGAYEHATRAFLSSFDDQPQLQQEIMDIYQSSLKLVWQVLIAFALAAFPLAVCIPEVELRKELVTEFGLQEDTEDRQQQNKAAQELGVELQVLGHRDR